MIGAIKIKDGLFIGDMLAATVSMCSLIDRLGLRICCRKQGDPYYKLRWNADP